MRKKAIFNLEIKKKSGSSINPDIHHSKVPSSDLCRHSDRDYTHTNYHFTYNTLKKYESYLFRPLEMTLQSLLWSFKKILNIF